MDGDRRSHARRARVKKLKDAALFWANAQRGTDTGPVIIDDELAAQLAELGVVYEQETPAIMPEKPAFDVMPENWKAVNAFLSLATQWRLVAVGMGGLMFTGLDYVAAAALFKSGHSKKSQAKFERLMARVRVMEQAALPILNEAG